MDAPVKAKADDEYPPINVKLYSIGSARVSPSTLDSLESIHHLLLSRHTTTRDVQEANWWLRIHREEEEKIHHLSKYSMTNEG